MLIAIGGLAAAEAAASPIVFRSEAALDHRTARLGDMADLSRLPPALRARAEALPVVTIPEGAGRLELERDRVIERTRARMPALAPYLDQRPAPGARIRLAFTGIAIASPALACVTVVRPLSAGAVPTQADFAPAACAGDPSRAAFRYDAASRVLRTSRDLEADELLPRPPAFATAVLPRGQKLQVETRVGPILLRRTVEAVQPVGPGGRVFVKASDGAVFAAPVPETTR